MSEVAKGEGVSHVGVSGDAASAAPALVSGDSVLQPSSSGQTWRRRLARLLPIMPTRYALVVVGGGLLVVASQGSDAIDGSVPHDGLALVVFAATALGFVCLLITASGPYTLHLPNLWGKGVKAFGLLTTALAALLAFGSVAALDGCIYLMQGIPLSHAYLNDVISFTYVNAKTALAGHNPYTDNSGFVEALRRFPAAGATPLRRGIFAHGYAYPSKLARAQAERAYVAYATGLGAHSGAHDPTGGAYDPRTLHSYPALSFLLYVPLIWLGVQDVLVLHVVVFAWLFAWLVWIAPPTMRRWAALAAASALALPFYSLNFDAEVICLAFILLAWHNRRNRRNRWVSAIALGLGCAFKQYCWLFAPFILLDAWLEYGWREALRRTALTLAVFLAPNLPYLIASPGAWLTSMALPVSEPLFPMGMGLITLSLGGWLPYLPTAAYSVLMLAALVGALWAYARWRPQLGEAALLLALVPLVFAWRSPANYFAIAPWLALYAANRWYLRRPNPVV